MRNAAIGPQPDSRKSNAPAFGFGAADRNASSKVYVSKEHSKVDFGKLGPGAVYETKSSFGKQVDAKKRSPASVGFGSADRFLQPSAARAKRNPQVPGPGSYPLPKAVGKQTQSKAVTEGSFGFGTSTRDHAEKVFIGKEQAKVFFGMESPGPAAYKVSSGVGKQPESRNTTEPGFTIPRGGCGKFIRPWAKSAMASSVGSSCPPNSPVGKAKIARSSPNSALSAAIVLYDDRVRPQAEATFWAKQTLPSNWEKETCDETVKTRRRR